MTTLKINIKKVNLELAFLTSCLLFFGILFSLLVPIGYGKDEPVHAYKASAVSRGQLSLKKIGPWHSESGIPITIYGGDTPRSLIELEQYANSVKLDSSCTQYFCDKPTHQQKQHLQRLEQEPIRDDLVATDFWGANGYSFIGYVPLAIGFGVARVFDTSISQAIHLGRMLNVLFCTIGVVTSFWLLSHYRFRWVVFGIALLPPVLFSFSSLGIDGILISLSLLLVAVAYLSLEKRQAIPKTALYIGALAALLLPLIKLPYILLSVLFLFLPVFRKDKKGISVRLILLLLILVPVLVWSAMSADATRTQYLTTYAGATEPNSSEQMRHILSHPIDTVRIFTKSILGNHIDSLGSATHQPGLQVPPDFITGSLMLILAATIYASGGVPTKKVRENRIFAVITLIGCAGVLFGISMMMYLNYNSVGATTLEGVQGRYSLPLFGFVTLSLSLLLGISVKPIQKIHKYLFMGLSTLPALATAIWYVGIVY